MDWRPSAQLLAPQKASRFRSLGFLCLQGCLKRFSLPWQAERSSSTIVIEPDPEPELSAYEELEPGLLNISDSEAFYDARSEASGSKASKVRSEVSMGSEKRTGLSRRQLAASQRLEALLSVRRLCHSGDTRGTVLDREGYALQVQVERLLAGEAAMWLCHTGGVDIGCSTCRVSGVELSEVLKALHDPTERLRWDAGNFRCFEVLTRAEELDELQEDVIYCVMPGPGLMNDRDVLQDRWKVPMDAGYAIVMQSKLDNSLRPEVAGKIRAMTLISGYLICTLPGGLEITAVSQTNLGGSIPAWVQSQGRRLAKSKLQPWAKRLESHCHVMRAERKVD